MLNANEKVLDKNNLYICPITFPDLLFCWRNYSYCVYVCVT